jgi:hypothetical protein
MSTKSGFPFCAIHSTVDLQVLWKLVPDFPRLIKSSHPREPINLSDGSQSSAKLQPLSRIVFILLYLMALDYIYNLYENE